MDDVLKRKSYTKGSPEQMVGGYYRAAFDMKTRNTLGMRPLEPLLKKRTGSRCSRVGPAVMRTRSEDVMRFP